jgi:hypothetical protein
MDRLIERMPRRLESYLILLWATVVAIAARRCAG